MTRASWIFIFSILFPLVGALHAGEGWLSFFAILILDGGLAILWVASAVLLGLALLRPARLMIPTSLRIATAGGLGLGIYSLGALGLGLLGLLNRNIAFAFPVLSVIAFLATHLPRVRYLSFPDLIARAEAWLNGKTNEWWIWIAPVSVLAAAAVAASLPPGAMWLESGDPHPYDVL